jgi:putative FmdB family regulatory protein
VPLYDYACSNGHTFERIVRYAVADEQTCHCGAALTRLPHKPHVEPDGIYSYAPNIGTEATFERRRAAVREGKKMIKKEIPNE